MSSICRVDNDRADRATEECIAGVRAVIRRLRAASCRRRDGRDRPDGRGQQRPRISAIGRFVDAEAGLRVTGGVWLASASVESVVRGIVGKRSNRIRCRSCPTQTSSSTPAP